MQQYGVVIELNRQLHQPGYWIIMEFKIYYR